VLLRPAYTGLVCLLAFRAAPERRRPARYVVLLVSLLVVVAGMLPDLTALLVREHVVESCVVPTGAMSPTVRPGDRVLVRKLGYEARRGDVIAFIPPDRSEDLYMMRLAAFGGETIEIRDGGAFINGTRLSDAPWGRFRFVNLGLPLQEYAGEGTPYTVPPGHVFVLGDHSERSRDSRVFGGVPTADILGRAYKRYWPPGRQGPIE